MSLQTTIVAALLEQPALLALPRPTVLADVVARFGCSRITARNAYAQARVDGHARTRRVTVPQGWRAQA